MSMKFETNLPLRDTFHELNKVMDKVEYKGSRYVFDSSTISGSLLQGNLQAGLEFRVSEVAIKEKVSFFRRKSEATLWYMDVMVRPSEQGQVVVRVTFHNRKEEQENEVLPANIMSCNFQIAPAIMTPFYLGKYEPLQAVMERAEPVNIQIPALPETREIIRRCLDQRIESVLHSRMLHNRVEGVFFAHLSLCWDEMLKSIA